ncbi:universal stress protein PHOS34-like [Quercus robur]|uniref:universal stress protein PHOS34-like n=1 Tax=Quercus robur TaxID=38942 RepID=UPI002163ED7E|nr:universal stress protein PHOS34-like [Quercus robur]
MHDKMRHPDEVTATPTSSSSSNNQKKLEDDFDTFIALKAADLARPLREAQIPYKIHIVKDHDMKERLSLEVERLGLSAVIMGSRGFGSVHRGNDDGGVSDYCVHHCICPIVIVCYPKDKDAVAEAVLTIKEGEEDDEAVIKTVPIEGVHEKG